MIGIVISICVGFVTTYAYGKRHMEVFVGDDETAGEVAVEINEDPEANVAAVQDEVLASPVGGTPISLKKVNDPVFAQEMMGKGIAVIPEEGTIYAPADGVLTVVYDSKHAYGLKTANGAEVLIHIGIDTVGLKGEGFETTRKYGELVKKGDILGTVDLEKLKQAGLDSVVMMIITNTDAYAAVEAIDLPKVDGGQDLLVVSAHYEN